MSQAAPLPARAHYIAPASFHCCRAFAACWALIGAVGCGYLFASSTLPVATVGDVPLWGPGWLASIAVGGALLLGLPWLVLPVALLPIGLVYLRREAPRRPHWRTAWVALTVAAVALEALFVTGFEVPFLAPNNQGRALVSWIQLPETAAFVAIGIALLAILARSARASDRPRWHKGWS
jgi:hypothetical protein